MPQKCLLTVDVEDYFHDQAFVEAIDSSTWDLYESRVERNTHNLLDLFDEYAAPGTFFVLGWVADRFPGLVREIHSRGHEIACHSYWHRLIYDLSPEQFREDTRRAKDVLEQAIGEAVTGYRAPTFSVTRQSLWALDVLAEEGFLYDSSIYPVRHDRYGIPDWDPTPRWVSTEAGRIMEIPNATTCLLGTNVACGGGGYMRLLPFAFCLQGLRRMVRQRGYQPVLYVHPWEIDPGQPRISSGMLTHVRHYTGLTRVKSRLRRFLGEFGTARMDTMVLGSQPTVDRPTSPAATPAQIVGAQ
jgi:polysaccharide deacetylase family protein (PEP-CTERM system associated)